MSATNWEEVYRTQTARIAELEATLDEITAANERATKRWQAAHPGKELVIPDQAKMVEWLLEELAKFDDPHRLHAHCVRHLTDAQVAHLFGERMTEIQNDRDRLQSENIALRELTATLGAPNHLGVPVPLYRELRADKARLDWLTNSLGWIIVGCPEADPSQHATEDGTLADAWRAAIDAARKEAQP